MQQPSMPLSKGVKEVLSSATTWPKLLGQGGEVQLSGIFCALLEYARADSGLRLLIGAVMRDPGWLDLLLQKGNPLFLGGREEWCARASPVQGAPFSERAQELLKAGRETARQWNTEEVAPLHLLSVLSKPEWAENIDLSLQKDEPAAIRIKMLLESLRDALPTLRLILTPMGEVSDPAMVLQLREAMDLKLYTLENQLTFVKAKIQGLRAELDVFQQNEAVLKERVRATKRAHSLFTDLRV